MSGVNVAVSGDNDSQLWSSSNRIIISSSSDFGATIAVVVVVWGVVGFWCRCEADGEVKRLASIDDDNRVKVEEIEEEGGGVRRRH